jgi:hypothetical protein
MNKIKKRRGRKFKNKSVEELIQLLKRMNKREDELIQHIRDLEFYIATLEGEAFEDEDILFATAEIEDTAGVGDMFDELDNPDDIQTYTMEQILATLEEPKKDKKKKKKKKK